MAFDAAFEAIAAPSKPKSPAQRTWEKKCDLLQLLQEDRRRLSIESAAWEVQQDAERKAKQLAAELDNESVDLPDVEEHVRTRQCLREFGRVIQKYARALEAGESPSPTPEEAAVLERENPIFEKLSERSPLLLLSETPEEAPTYLQKQVMDAIRPMLQSEAYIPQLEKRILNRSFDHFAHFAKAFIEKVVHDQYEEQREWERMRQKRIELDALLAMDPLRAAQLMATEPKLCNSEYTYRLQDKLTEQFKQCAQTSFAEGLQYYLTRLRAWPHQTLRDSFNTVRHTAMYELHTQAAQLARAESPPAAEGETREWYEGWHQRIRYLLRELPCELAELINNDHFYGTGDARWSHIERVEVYQAALEAGGWESIHQVAFKDLGTFLESPNQLPGLPSSVKQEALQRFVEQGSIGRNLMKYVPIVAAWDELGSASAFAILKVIIQNSQHISVVEQLLKRFSFTPEQELELVQIAAKDWPFILCFKALFKSADAQRYIQLREELDGIHGATTQQIAFETAQKARVDQSPKTQEQAEAAVQRSIELSTALTEQIIHLRPDRQAAELLRQEREYRLRAPIELVGLIGKGVASARMVMFSHTQEYGVYKAEQDEPKPKNVTEQPTRFGIHPGECTRREWLIAQIDKALCFDLTPPTILRTGPRGVGSVQSWETGTVANLFPNVNTLPVQSLMKLALFDAMIENTDRHNGNYLLEETPSGIVVKAIDHGYCLSRISSKSPDGLRSAPIDRVGQNAPIPAELREQIRAFLNASELKEALRESFLFALGEEAYMDIWNRFLERLDYLAPTDVTVPSYLPATVWS